MKEINTEDYRVTGTEKLSEIDTYEDFNESEKKLKKELKNIRKDLGDFQDTLYAMENMGSSSACREWILRARIA